jgi:hypothetical protein
LDEEEARLAILEATTEDATLLAGVEDRAAELTTPALLAGVEDRAAELTTTPALLLAGIEDGAAELTTTPALLAGVEDGAMELTAPELLAGVEDGAAELTARLELLTAIELLLFGLLPEEPLPPHAVSAHNTEHRMPVATFFM